jgi:hypothetical protein
MTDRNDDTSRRLVRSLSRPFRGPGERGPVAGSEARAVDRPIAAPFAAPGKGAPHPAVGSGDTLLGSEVVPVPDDDLPAIDAFTVTEPAADAAAASGGGRPAGVSAPFDAAEVAGPGYDEYGTGSQTRIAEPTAGESNYNANDHGSSVAGVEVELEPNATSEYEAVASVQAPPVMVDERASRRYSPSAASWPEDVWNDAPARETRQSAEGSPSGRQHAALSQAETPGLQQSHPLADALEAVARRIRSGELPVTGYEAGMGDAAALTAALGAVMGLRK